MPIVTFNHITHDCAVAYKGPDYVRLVDENGMLVARFDGVSDFSGFSIANGSWSVPSEKNCCLATFNEDGTISRGGTVVSSTVGTYTHSASGLTGSGENGKFKATTSGTISTIKVNGKTCSVKCGEDSSMDLIAGCWYTFILDGDVVNFNMGGAGSSGGSELTIVGGTTHPAKATQNTVWVDTNVEITGHALSATEPESPAEGMVWVTIGTFGKAKVTSPVGDDWVVVYLSATKQYVNGAWESKPAMTYQDGVWTGGDVYYYRQGNTYDDVTGGYTLDDATLEADNIKVYINGEGQVGYITTNSKVDISGISTLYLKFDIKVVSSYSRTATVYLKVSDSKLTSVDGSVGSGAESYNGYAQDTEMGDTISLDVSSVTGEKYIFVGLKNSGKYQNTTMNIKEIRGE